MSNILVTGGAGYIGSHACKALSAAGHVPICYDNLSRGHGDLVQWGPFEEGDIRDRARLDEVMARHQPQAVMHFAAFAYVGESVAKPELYHDNNVVGTRCLLEATAAADVAHLVLSSTCAVYGTPEQMPVREETALDPESPYGRTKMIMEQMASESEAAGGASFVALRYFNAAGADPAGETGERHEPETHLIPNALAAVSGRGEALTVFGDDYDTEDGTCVRDYIHVSDIAAAHVLALGYLQGNGTSCAVNLGNGQGYSVKQVLDEIQAITGQAVPYSVGPRREGDPPRVTADASKARERLNWTPDFPALKDQVAHAWAWHQKDWR